MSYPTVLIQQPNRKPLYISLRDTLELGRECDGIILGDPQVSRRHATLGLSGDRVLVEDLGSTNGTFLDGQRIAAPVSLEAGSQVRLGDTTVDLVRELSDAYTTIGHDTQGADSARSTMASDGAVTIAPGGPAGIRETSIDVVAKAVEVDRPGLKSIEQDQGTITIVFSDIENSTQRATAMGDDAWMRVLGTHNDIIRRGLDEYGGTEVKNQGDGFMLTFPGARRALRCMISVQQELTRYDEANPDQGVRIRVGVHTGEVVVEEGDIFGKHVMQAARVANLAEGGEILVSSLVREIASARGDIEFGDGRVATMKGIEGEHTVYPVVFDLRGE